MQFPNYCILFQIKFCVIYLLVVESGEIFMVVIMLNVPLLLMILGTKYFDKPIESVAYVLEINIIVYHFGQFHTILFVLGDKDWQLLTRQQAIERSQARTEQDKVAKADAKRELDRFGVRSQMTVCIMGRIQTNYCRSSCSI
jgi:hypothetical protein